MRLSCSQAERILPDPAVRSRTISPGLEHLRKAFSWSVGGFWVGCVQSTAQPVDQVCFKDKCVEVEVVQKEEELRRGLQFRKSLDPDRGMLFIFQKSWPYAFWMKDTLIPLDMIWIDDARKIVYIEHDVPPCATDPCPSYPPKHEALYVLEINAGYAAKLGLQLGDTAEFRFNSF